MLFPAHLTDPKTAFHRATTPSGPEFHDSAERAATVYEKLKESILKLEILPKRGPVVPELREVGVLERIVKSGELIGLDVDLAKMLAGAFGVEAKFVTKPFPQLLAALKASEVDIVVSGMAITAERSIDVTFVGPYLLTGNSILTNSRTLAAIENAGEINRANIKLAALANSTSQRFVERALPEAKLITTQDYDTAVNMVLNDEVDALVADMSVCLLSMLRFPGKGLATLNQPLALEPAGIAMLPNLSMRSSC